MEKSRPIVTGVPPVTALSSLAPVEGFSFTLPSDIGKSVSAQKFVDNCKSLAKKGGEILGAVADFFRKLLVGVPGSVLYAAGLIAGAALFITTSVALVLATIGGGITGTVVGGFLGALAGLYLGNVKESMVAGAFLGAGVGASVGLSTAFVSTLLPRLIVVGIGLFGIGILKFNVLASDEDNKSKIYKMQVLLGDILMIDLQATAKKPPKAENA